jgi:hypothetical protein
MKSSVSSVMFGSNHRRTVAADGILWHLVFCLAPDIIIRTRNRPESLVIAVRLFERNYAELFSSFSTCTDCFVCEGLRKFRRYVIPIL